MAYTIADEKGARQPVDRLESLAFQFCKIATFTVFTGKFALPLASTLCCLLFVAAYLKGRRESRCVLKYPLAIAAVWGVVSIAAWAFVLNPGLRDRLLAIFLAPIL